MKLRNPPSRLLPACRSLLFVACACSLAACGRQDTPVPPPRPVTFGAYLFTADLVLSHRPEAPSPGAM